MLGLPSSLVRIRTYTHALGDMQANLERGWAVHERSRNGIEDSVIGAIFLNQIGLAQAR